MNCPYCLSIAPFVIVLAGLDVGLFPAGVLERLSALVILIWFEVVAFRLLRLAFHREPGPGKRDGMIS
jgi:hypothetical protein